MRLEHAHMLMADWLDCMLGRTGRCEDASMPHALFTKELRGSAACVCVGAAVHAMQSRGLMQKQMRSIDLPSPGLCNVASILRNMALQTVLCPNDFA
eukprot:scaffold86163_cov20-Tisochrysis_lutea.AAC.1